MMTDGNNMRYGYWVNLAFIMIVYILIMVTLIAVNIGVF
jgi:hypothetical protein